MHTPRIHNAIRFAIETHEVNQKQKRKGKDIPYITHPLTVGVILAFAGAEEDVVIAGILHDTIEDSTESNKVTRELLAKQFGEAVAGLVESVTEARKDLPWEVRKEEALAHIETFSRDSLLVKSADIISNMNEILDDYNQDGDALWGRFNASKAKTLDNKYRSITAILRRWPESPLAADLHALITRLIPLLESK